MFFKLFKKVTNTLRTLRHIESSFQTPTNHEMPGALYNYVIYGQGVQDFPVDRDEWSRLDDSPEPMRSITPASSTVMERQPFTPPRVTTEPMIVQNRFKETRENSAPRMRTLAEIKAAKLRREQKKMALSKKRKSRWGFTKVERLVVAQEAVNKKY